MAFISKGPNLRTKWNLFTMYAKIYIDRWVKAGEIKQDKEKAKTFKKFGILGIVWALVAAASVFPCVWVATMLFKLAMTNLGFFTYFILIGNIVLFVFGIAMLAPIIPKIPNPKSTLYLFKCDLLPFHFKTVQKSK